MLLAGRLETMSIVTTIYETLYEELSKPAKKVEQKKELIDAVCTNSRLTFDVMYKHIIVAGLAAYAIIYLMKCGAVKARQAKDQNFGLAIQVLHQSSTTLGAPCGSPIVVHTRSMAITGDRAGMHDRRTSGKSVSRVGRTETYNRERTITFRPFLLFA